MFPGYNDSFKVLYINGRGLDSFSEKLPLADNVLFYYQAPLIPMNYALSSADCCVLLLICWAQVIP